MSDNTTTNECLKKANDSYRQNYDDIFRKKPALEIDPKTGELAEKRPAGEDDTALQNTAMLILCAAAV